MTTKPAAPATPMTDAEFAVSEYPRLLAERAELVDVLLGMLETHAADSIKGAIQHYARNRGDVQKASQARTATRALLARLGGGS